MKLLLKAFLVLLFIFSFNISSFAEEVKTISIVTPEWENQTNKDGSGFFFDIIRSVYNPFGIKLKYKIVPWKRAEHLVATNKADAMLCVAIQNIGKQLAPKYPMAADYTVAVFKRDKIKDWKGIESLTNKSSAWLLGYDFHMNPHMKNIKLKEWNEITDYKNAWHRLEKGRLDVYMDAYVDVKHYIKNNKIDMSSFQIENLWEDKYFISFAISDHSKKLIEIYDDQIIKLVESGELQKLFEKWDIYPFSQHFWDK
ncbi:transporter substrate-binding domain-containing protein [Desulfobacterales bacterium HSG16]|nr:transporter substrate-binding domain-containing protein [Desulfobacterales bacterium HSG16]